MATAATYITHKELKRIFPQLDEFDQKVQIFGWSNFGSGNIYEANDTGLVTALFSDGRKLNPATSLTSVSTTSTTTTVLDNAPDADSTNFNTVTLADASSFNVGDIISIGTIEKALITGKSSNTLTIRRGFDGSSITSFSISTTVAVISKLSEEFSWYYSSSDDIVLLYSSTNPNDLLIEAGEDFSTMVAQYLADASRYFDSRVDPSLPKEQLKDKSGNYDYMVIRTVGLIAACFLIRSKDHASDMAQSFMDEADRNIELLNEGKAALSWQNTADASQGVIRQNSTIQGALHPVDTRGEYTGTWDLLKLEIQTAGQIGTATFNVLGKDSDGLKNNKIVDNEKITGDYQYIAPGLQIRFAGAADDSAAHADDEWEIEVMGRQELVDTSDLQSVKLTRTGTPARRRYR